MLEMENMDGILEIRVRVCRGVLRFWGPRIQDSRTDFRPKTWKFIGSTTMRGWCKIENLVEGYYRHMETTSVMMEDWQNIRFNKIVCERQDINVLTI